LRDSRDTPFPKRNPIWGQRRNFWGQKRGQGFQNQKAKKPQGGAKNSAPRSVSRLPRGTRSAHKDKQREKATPPAGIMLSQVCCTTDSSHPQQKQRVRATTTYVCLYRLSLNPASRKTTTTG